MIVPLLKQSTRLANKAVVLSARRNVHKGWEGAPPMRFIGPLEHVARYLFLSAAMLSYPTWVLLNLDNLRPHPVHELSPEMQEIMAERQARRAEGKQPILQDWPVIHEKKQN